MTRKALECWRAHGFRAAWGTIGPRAPSRSRPSVVVATFSVNVSFHESEYLLEGPRTYGQMLMHQWA